MTSVMMLHVLPRQTMTREEFIANTPRNSIALDGMVLGGPFSDETSMHVNFDHHDGVVREATMSTCMQVYFAIKGELMEAFRENGRPAAHIYINDTDQDTSMAVWLLCHYKLFEGMQSIPAINHLLRLNNNWDITGGAYPVYLDDHAIRQFCWIFELYTTFRQSGALYEADEGQMRENIFATMGRIDDYLLGKAGEKQLDIRHEILYDSPLFKIIDELGGNEARYYLFRNGLRAFISLVARRTDGRFVYTIGRKQYVPLPIENLYDDFNLAEGLTRLNGWNGSNIIGGSSRLLGSGLSWQELLEIVKARLQR